MITPRRQSDVSRLVFGRTAKVESLVHFESLHEGIGEERQAEGGLAGLHENQQCAATKREDQCDRQALQPNHVSA